MAKITRPLRKDAVPVILVAGFLGAGKTTFINALLRSASGVRIAVIVNDFGATNIDSLLIASQADRKLELTNGCVCCSMENGDLEEALAAVLESMPDVILIEASGIAEPEEVMRLLLLSPNKSIGYGGMLYLLDGLNYQKVFAKYRRLSTHITSADMVIITKTELMPDAEVATQLASVQTMTQAPIVHAGDGMIAPELLFDIPKRKDLQPLLLQQDADHNNHLHHLFQTMTFTTKQPLRFEALKQLLDTPLAGVYRIKGVVYFGAAGYMQKFILQYVGGRWDMYCEEWSDADAPATTLVVIGTSFDERAIIQKIRDCQGEGSVMLDIDRYNKD